MAVRSFLPTVSCLAWLSAAAGAQTLNPSDFGKVTLHLKADSLLPLADQAPVTAWGPMKSAGDQAPLFVASDSRFNNQPVVKFDGVNDRLLLDDADLNARTIFAVVVMDTGAPATATLFSNGADGLDLRRNASTFRYAGNGAGATFGDFTGNTPVGTIHINSGTAPDSVPSPNGTFTADLPHLVRVTGGDMKNFSSFWIGSEGTDLPRYWKGSVAELLIYDGVVTADSIRRIGWYFQTKYALPTTYTLPTPVVRTFTATAAGPVTSPAGVLSSPGAPVTLTWQVENGTTVSISNGALASSTEATGTVTVSPTVTTTYTLTVTNNTGPATRALTVHIGSPVLPPQITEFMADNDGALLDEDGNPSDWIEIYNPNAFALDLQGYALKDSGTRWEFPAGAAVPAAGYRVIFASGLNRTNPAGNLHTSFSLSSGGEYLGLIQGVGGAVVSEFAPAYPPQFVNRSHGRFGTPPQTGYFGAPAAGLPTPGAANSATGVQGFLDETDDTKFAAGRGFYTAAVHEVITCKTPGATIIYTTNGSNPTTLNGTKITAPDALTPPKAELTIHPAAVPAGAEGTNIATIGGTTTLRAAVFLDGFAPTNIDTQTYLFAAQVLAQTPSNATAKGWPASSTTGQVLNYGMDAAVVSSFPPEDMLASLQSLPALSIVTPQANLTAVSTGIYVNADQHGATWERPVSAELIFPPGYVSPDGNAAGFQIDAGLRIRGGYSRNDSFYKHGLRLYFSKKYDGKLQYPLFGREGTSEFGKLDLGTGSNYGWFRESSYSNGKFNTMCRDMFCRDTQGALGQPYTKSRFYHLYLNGVYWGVYYSEERAEAEFAASYMGGDADEYDAVKCGNHIGGFATEATDGSMTTWFSLWSKVLSLGTTPVNTPASNAKYFEILGRNPDGTRNPDLPVLLDVDNLIDEMLVIFYGGDGDAVLSNFLGRNQPNNWFSVYRRDGSQGFRFFIRDAEHTLGTPNSVVDQTGPWGGSNKTVFAYSNPQWMHEDLMKNAEYKLRFADHVQRHFFNDGALTPARCIARFDNRANQLRLAMKSESARWGDAQAVTGQPTGHPAKYIVADWESAITTVKSTVMPNRSNIVLAQLKTDGLYPTTTAAPVFLNDTTSAAQHGGPITQGFQLRITAAAGAILYTLDGSDPRAVGGAAAAGALTYTAPVALSGSSTVNARVLNGTTWSALSSAFFTVDTVPASAANLVVSQLSYNPPSGNGYEYIEFMNIGTSAIDFTGVHLRDGIDYDFPANTTLAPGQRLEVAGDPAAFATLFTTPGLRVLGPFVGNLSNSGERILVVSDSQGTIRDFTWNDKSPWPAEADGQGNALVLINPAANPDHALPSSWRGSMNATATPGAADAVAFTGDAAADADGDGFTALMEYFLGTSDTDPQAGHGVLVPSVIVLTNGSGESVPYPAVTFTRRNGSDSIRCTVEVSPVLAPWTPGTAAAVMTSQSRAGDIITQTWRSPIPQSAWARQFLRLRIQQ
ncbi:MAG: lamin tail domain-containing protein [Verrucomicrobiota bacterium]